MISVFSTCLRRRAGHGDQTGAGQRENAAGLVGQREGEVVELHQPASRLLSAGKFPPERRAETRAVERQKRFDLETGFLEEMRGEELLLGLIAVQDVEAFLPRLCGGESVGFTLKRPDKYLHVQEYIKTHSRCIV